MGRYEVDLIVCSGRQLKNVNWRNGDLNPYVVAWVDSSSKCSTKVATDGDTDPDWVDAKLTISIPSDSALDEAILFLEVYHYGEAEGTKPLVGSARLRLQEVVDEVGIGSKMSRTIKLKRPSGRPQGKIDIKVAIKEPNRYDQGSSYASAGGYGYGQPAYGAPATGYPYTSAPAAGGYAYGGAAQAPAAGGYAYGGAAQAPAAGGYAYGGAAQAPAAGGYAYGGATQAPQKKSSFGLGTGLAVGAAAGILGGLALSEGLDYVEDKIADKVVDHIEERVEDDIAGDYYDGEF